MFDGTNAQHCILIIAACTCSALQTVTKHCMCCGQDAHAAMSYGPQQGHVCSWAWAWATKSAALEALHVRCWHSMSSRQNARMTSMTHCQPAGAEAASCGRSLSFDVRRSCALTIPCHVGKCPAGLMQDNTGAAGALQRAAELKPDNEYFKAGLIRLMRRIPEVQADILQVQPACLAPHHAAIIVA